MKLIDVYLSRKHVTSKLRAIRSVHARTKLANKALGATRESNNTGTRAPLVPKKKLKRPVHYNTKLERREKILLAFERTARTQCRGMFSTEKKWRPPCKIVVQNDANVPVLFSLALHVPTSYRLVFFLPLFVQNPRTLQRSTPGRVFPSGKLLDGDRGS